MDDKSKNVLENGGESTSRKGFLSKYGRDLGVVAFGSLSLLALAYISNISFIEERNKILNLEQRKIHIENIFGRQENGEFVCGLADLNKDRVVDYRENVEMRVKTLGQNPDLAKMLGDIRNFSNEELMKINDYYIIEMFRDIDPYLRKAK